MSRVDLLKYRISEAAKSLRLGLVLPLAPMVRIYGGTDKLDHGYVPGYVSHLRARRWRPNRVLEIGVGGYEPATPGGSLQVWRDYLPRSTIVGLDLHDKDVDLGPRVRFVQGDQSDSRDLDRALEVLGGPPDVVIDDGSHLAGHVVVSFDHLFPRMPSGALYVIEDLHTSYWGDYGGGVPAPEDSAVGFLRALIDSVQATDPTFSWELDRVAPRTPRRDVARVDVRPGVAFIEKSGRQG